MREKSTATKETPSTPSASGRRAWAASGAPQSSPNGGAVFGLGMIGALVYFFGIAETPRDRFMAFGKAMVWPALLVHRAFKVLGN